MLITQVAMFLTCDMINKVCGFPSPDKESGKNVKDEMKPDFDEQGPAI